MTRGTRTRHGTSIRLHRSCDRVGAQQQKVWRTIGQRRLIVIGAFEMRLTITPESGGSRLVAGIDYTLPEPWAGRLLGRVLARPYSRWCLRRICRDAESALEKT